MKHDPLLFRRQLCRSLLGLLGAVSIAACTGRNRADGSGLTHGAGTGGATSHPGSGTGGAVSHSGSGGTVGTGNMAGTGGMEDGGLFDAGPGGGGSGSGGSGSGGSVPAAQECFDWPPNGGFPLTDAGDDAGDASPMLIFDAGPPTDDCPTNTPLVIYEIAANTCVGGTGWDPYNIVSGPARNASDQCCYKVDLRLCVNGGRPYLVDDCARLSALVRGKGGWADVAEPNLDSLGVEQRASLAGAWASAGLSEHASIASFSRFALALLAVGAPADLVASAHQAALDEIQHARLCFALASAYAGEDVAPGPFPLGTEVHFGACLAEVAASTVVEGCVGETVAAVVASEQLARATDPAVRAALARIAADEARHAELAWRTVAWAVRAGGTAVRAAVTQAFRDALAAGSEEWTGQGTGSLAMQAHGLLDAATLATVVASAKREVVVPSARMLLRIERIAPIGASDNA